MNNIRYFIILPIFYTVLFGFSISMAAEKSGKWVSFESAPINGKSILLGAHMYKPEGKGPFPAVIVLHGCAGVEAHHKNWAIELVKWGYASLVVDSFSARSVKNICLNVWKVTSLERASDAFGAALYLRQQPSIDPDSIGILGFSNGAVAGLKAVQKNIKYVFDLDSFPFKAAVLFYPWCDSSTDQDIAIPTMIHIGSFDDWTQSYRCTELQRLVTKPEMLELNVYEGAYHSFDRPGGKRKYLNHVLEYNPAAAQQALKKTKAFFDRYLLGK